MKYLDKKTAEEMAEKCDFAQPLKCLELDDLNCIELWLVEHDQCLVRDRCLPTKEEEIGYWIWVEMGGLGQWVICKTKNLVEACQQFNTILVTMRA